MSDGATTELAERARRLLASQDLALALLDRVEQQEIIRPGVTESEVSTAIHRLAEDEFGVERHWHKRVVRGGPNTLEPYSENPPDRVIAADDIVFVDLGPVFVDWEADVGRTYVLGADPHKLHLRDQLAAVFDAGRACFEADPGITGAQLFAQVVAASAAVGCEFGGPIAGHLVGEFPHATIVGSDLGCYIHPDNHAPLRGHEAAARGFFWILEVHLVDRGREIGGFYEQLLNLDAPARG